MKRILMTLTFGFGIFLSVTSQGNSEDLSLDKLDLFEESILEPKHAPSLSHSSSS